MGYSVTYMANATSFDEAQFKQILAAMSNLHNDGWWHWLPVASVFVSVLLAFLIGIGLEKYKSWRATKIEREKKCEQEIRQINAVVAGIGFNIETLVHISAQKHLASS